MKRGTYIIIAIFVVIVIMVVGFYIFKSLNEKDTSSQNQDIQNQSINTQTKSNIENTNTEENENQSNTGQGKMVIAYGNEVQQGIAIYNQYNPEECLYSIFFACDVFENGCDDEGIMDYCKNKCVETGGRPSGTGGFARLQNEGVINAVQCFCSQCLSSETGEKNFEFVNTRTLCRDSFGKNGIEVVVKNTGSSDISKNDWVVHKIDGQEIDVWPFDIKVGESGQVFTVVKTKDKNYTSGEHNIEVGLSQDNIKTTKVTCP
ncbi:hypothetical protein FJZ19_02185 [Candidatus Pacearchaeota archaeon]|nr:hypothetical protein [Candidatus Pacearchaeota archaeon]